MSKGARKPSPPQTAVQRQRDLARMLVRMDEMLKSIGDLAARARARVSVGGLNRYRRFAKRVRDFFALAAVAEEKLYNMPELADSPMATALDRMHARMVVLFVEGSWGFFDLYRRVPELPLGAHEICGVELRGLHEIRKFLNDERYDGERGQALRRQAERVTDLMHEIMERVPPLEDFGDLPSISAKGVSRQPIKTPPKRRAEPPPPPPPVEQEQPQWAEAVAPQWVDAAAPQWTEAAAPQWGETAAPSWTETAAPSWTVMPGDEGGGGAATSHQTVEYDDSAYLDDAPEEGEVEPPASPSLQPQPSRAEPSPLVRELTLDMVEAEERRAALAERLTASGRQAPPPAASASSPPPSRSAAAPFRAPPALRPVKRS